MDAQTVGQAISPEVIAHFGCNFFALVEEVPLHKVYHGAAGSTAVHLSRARGPDFDLQLFTDGLMCSDLVMQPGFYTHSTGMSMTHILVVKIFSTGIIALLLPSTLSPIRFLHFRRVYYLQLGLLPQLIALCSNMIVHCNQCFNPVQYR